VTEPPQVTLLDLLIGGACRGSDNPAFLVDDPDQHFPDPYVTRVCQRCQLRPDCLAYALDNEASDGEAGVWGGTTPYQRRQLKTEKLNRVRCPGCLSESVMATDRGELCLSCGLSWLV
jgi:hypothetical protein